MNPSKAATESAPTASLPNSRLTPKRRRAHHARRRFFSPQLLSSRSAQLGRGRSAKDTSGFDPHQHHQVEHSVFGPASEPAYPPVVEPGAHRNRCAKAKEFRLHLHVVFCPSFGHTQSSLCACGRASPTGRRNSGAGRQGLRHDLRGCLQTRNRPKPSGGIVVCVGPRRVPHRKASILEHLPAAGAAGGKEDGPQADRTSALPHEHRGCAAPKGRSDEGRNKIRRRRQRPRTGWQATGLEDDPRGVNLRYSRVQRER